MKSSKAHGLAKLTADQVRSIHQAYWQEWKTQTELAEAYGVSVMTVHRIVNKISYKHVDR
jgi:DNA-binding transcriptional regulator LsrR (DeoR family)